jgi:hypothetical protein
MLPETAPAVARTLAVAPMLVGGSRVIEMLTYTAAAVGKLVG